MNKRELSKVLIFIVGAVTGSAVTWHFSKKHYDKILESEFQSMQDYFEAKWLERSEQEVGELKEAVESFGYTAQEMADMAREKPSIMEYAAKLQDAEYVDYAAVPVTEESNEVKEESPQNKAPYVISPEMVENSEYNLMTLTYYADEVLTDDWNDTENYADDLAGSDFANHFGDFVEDVVHVRNDHLGIDYEITYDPRNYSDIVNLTQHSTEDE